MSLANRIANLFRRSSVDREIDRELAAHIAMRIEDNVTAGMTPKEARRDALVRFGSRSAAKERTAEADAALFATGIWADLRYAIRQLLRAPGFACTAIVVLALGIAASVAIFAFVDAALIKPLPYRDPGRLVALFESNPLGPRFHLSYLDYLDWKRINSAFRSLDAYDDTEFMMDATSGAQRAPGASVSDGFFRTLGVAPALGRSFRAGEDLPSAPRTVLLSYAAWQTRYGARADVLGQTVMLNGLPNTIIGVLPQGFHFAPVGSPEFWTTLHRSTSEDRGEHGLLAIARLKDGIDLKTASANLSSIAETLAKQYPDADAGRGATVVELPEMIAGRFRPVLLVLLSGAALLLLIAYVNVASLLLVRSENRRLEVTLRGALGATPGRLARQFVTEGILLAALGCGIGLSAASVAMKLLTKLIPTEMMSSMPYLQGLGLNTHVLLFSGLLTAGATLLFSVVPLVALAASSPFQRPGLSAGLSAGQRGFAGTLWRRIGSNLVVIELATAMVLLVCAGLLGKSFYRLLHTELGMQPDHLAVLRVDTPRTGYEKNEQLANLARTIISRVESLPGVQSVGLTHNLPVDGGGNSSTFKIVGRPPSPSPSEEVVRQVSPDYFRTLHSRLLRGRFFLPADDASHPQVVIVNEAMARRHFPGEDPLGKRIMYDDSSPKMEVVGVVEDVKEGELDHATRPILYVPYAQDPGPTLCVIARTSQSEESLLPVIAAAIHEIDPGLMTYDAETMIDRINSSQAAYLHRSSAWLVGGFAALALVLAVVGLYGVISYSVSQRTREIGVRMALGAQQSSVYRMILSEAGWLSGIGIAAGLLCSVAAAILMRSLLFGTQAWDAATLIAVAILLAAAAMFASYIPARRAASVNPVEALRAE